MQITFYHSLQTKKYMKSKQTYSKIHKTSRNFDSSFDMKNKDKSYKKITPKMLCISVTANKRFCQNLGLMVK